MKVISRTLELAIVAIPENGKGGSQTCTHESLGYF